MSKTSTGPSNQQHSSITESVQCEETEHPIAQQPLINRFKLVYQQLNADNAQSELLDSIYTDDIRFIDPLHQVHGLTALKDYCQNLYTDLNGVHFEFLDDIYSETRGCIQWTLTFKHKRLNKGQSIRVEGISHLIFNDNKIVQHQDYFDAGALLYEHIPVLGYSIQTLKNRIKPSS